MKSMKNNVLFIRTIMILLLSCATIKVDFCFSSVQSSLRELPLDGNFTFTENEFAATDFGNRYHFPPLAVLHPKSVSDIALTIKHIWDMGPVSKLTVAARGHGHSTRGQAQADQGIVINMRSLTEPKMQFNFNTRTRQSPYVDVSAGELWINILHESLKHGLAPKTWTDYLHLTVGGTLSNAGISGQAFRHGPQISNVYQLEVVTGKGDVINCSEEQNADLFHGVLGGLGQFGIITRARISLEPAPKMVKWIRVLYSNFTTFSRDQELLISAEKTFDYIEGFVYINRMDVLNSWRSSSFNPQDPTEATKFVSDGTTLYCLELTKYFNPDKANTADQEIERILPQLSYISSTLFMTQVSYMEFLDRVHTSELKLRSKGLWDVPHPWLNLFIPRSKIKDFAHGVFGNILKNTSNGPVLIYPVNKSKWDNRTSAVLPEEDIFYMVAILFHAPPSPAGGTDGLEYLLTLNQRILDFCKQAHLGAKQYLAHYNTQEQWQAHFGQRWQVFVQRKFAYDPLAILSPGQRIFQKGISIL